MPKVILTFEDQRRAEMEKTFRRQDRVLRAIIREKVFRKISYDELAARAGVGRSTVQKFVNHPEQLRLEHLRKCCIAADIPLIVSGGEI